VTLAAAFRIMSGYGMAAPGGFSGWSTSARSSRTFRCFDKSGRADGTFSREDFAYDQQSDVYICPAGKVLASTGTLMNDGMTLLYRASKYDCDPCELKPRCCPKMPSRKVPRAIHGKGSRRCPRNRQDGCLCQVATRTEEDRDAVRASQAHLASRRAQTKRPIGCPR
jgi:hypothetical protein